MKNWVPRFVITVVLFLGTMLGGLYLLIPQEFDNDKERLGKVWEVGQGAANNLARDYPSYRKEVSLNWAKVVYALAK